MKASYWQRGETLDYTNSTASTIEHDTIIAVGDRVGVAGCTIKPGQVGSLHIEGTFKMPKSSTNAIAQGTTVYLNSTGITEAADDGGSPATAYPRAGIAAQSAAAADTEILVVLC